MFGSFVGRVSELGNLCNFDERNNPELLVKLEQYGGVTGIAALLKSDTKDGLTTKSQESSVPVPEKTLLKKKVIDEELRKSNFGENKM